MALFLAIDTGGTKTRCLLADENKILGRSSTGSVKLMRVSEAEASSRLQAMLAEVSQLANVNLGEVSQTCVGLAGLSIDAVREWAEREIGALVGGDLHLVGDEEIALDGAFRGGPGILIIAGTGSNIMGRAADGAMYQAGGWGPALGDEGSGFWIGQEALRAGFWAKDRGITTTLLADIGEFWGLKSLGEIVEMANVRPGPDLPALVPVIVRCAEAGDELAIAVLERAGVELAEQVALVALKMKESGGRRKIEAAYTGSILEHIALVRAAMIAALKTSSPSVKVMEGVVDSLEGALWRAREAGKLVS
ncbi:BadF/BadG/BcrA/BcrD ATPase family protein [Tunturiibacter gelidoferens]|uniref:N-acetylglucosamine kinase-like BadF-type ATPase n=1 Tax=Tunturiibacter lichenicola TaxID=2051959 RepID=A0A7Y9NM55_9BACT|nr:BadF/BadG/BcrA/BcrD ATPase family protein [Edaphobacter lichenicola]NYF51888.1 N-acetylglucosamine kinase-like BadF-type ATPase [Edaphobacter lichenicola]